MGTLQFGPRRATSIDITELPAADTAPLVELREGIPVWVHGPVAVPVTSEMVGELAEG